MFHGMKDQVPLQILTPDVFEEIFDELEKHRHASREWRAFMETLHDGNGINYAQDGRE